MDAGRAAWNESGHDEEEATALMKAWWRGKTKDFDPGMLEYKYIDTLGKLYTKSRALSFPGGGGPMYDVIHPTTGLPVRKPSRGWGCIQSTMTAWIAEGRVEFGPDETTIPTYKRLLEDMSHEVPKPTFHTDRRSATGHLQKILGDKRFPFPKNHDVLMRWVRIAAPADAIILDFFGGSGTTAEAVMRLNAEDGGTRQAILVTNNELAKADDTKLRKAGHKPGDDAYEALGVFHHVTRPRLETVATGIRPDGSTYSEGLAANVAFFDLTYFDSAEVTTGRALEDLVGLFWLKAGGTGAPIEITPAARKAGYAISESGSTAVLFKPAKAKTLADQLKATGQNIGHLFIVTDSPSQGDEAATYFAGGTTIERMYGNYLESFQVNGKA